MIQPINQNTNKMNLKPVEVPHFTGGITKIEKPSPDSFSKNAVKKSKTAVKKQSSFSIDQFKTDVQKKAVKFMGAAKSGSEKGVLVIQNSARKASDFTVSFTKSFFEDLKGVVKEKGVKTIKTVDSIL